MFQKDRQYFQFCTYGFLKNLRLFEPFLILFLQNEGMTFTQIGLLYAFREIARNIFEIPGGVFADSVGRKKSLLLAFSSYLLSFLIFYLSGGFSFFILAFLFYAFGDAFRTGTHKAMIMTYLKMKGWFDFKVDYYGHTRSWSQFGSAISAVLAGLVVLLTGQYKLAFALSALPYCLELINLALYPKYLDKVPGQNPSVDLGSQIKQTTKDFIKSIQNKEVWQSIVNLSVYTGYYKASKDYIQPLIQVLALSLPFFTTQSTIQREAILIGVIYFIIYFSTSMISRRSGKWVRKQNSVQSAMMISLYSGASLGFISGIFILLGFKVLAILFFVGIYMFENLRKPIGIGQISENLDQKILASALSVASQAETIFAAIFAIVLGILVDQTGLGLGIMLISGIVLIIPYIAILVRPANGRNIRR